MSLSISELYNKIYGELKEIRDSYDSVKVRLSADTEEDIVMRERRITNLEEQLEKIAEYREKVDYYRHQAEKKLESKNLLTITPRELNFNRLRNWAMMMDPEATDDPYAQRIYVQCMCNEMFLDLKEQEFTQTLEELRNTSGTVDEELIRETEKAVNKLIERETALFARDDSKNFLQALSERQSEAVDVDAMEGLSADETRELFSIGSYAVPFPVLDELKTSVKAKYGSFYQEEEDLVLLPAVFYSDKEFILRIEASPSREKVLYRGVQNLLLNRLVSGGNAKQSVVVLDGVHYNNQILGVLRPLEGSVIEPIPQNAEAVIDSLKQIIYSFTELDEKIGFADSVGQFNASASPEERITRRTVVVVGYPHAFNGEGKDLVQRLIYNYDHYGISLVLIDTRYSPRSERSSLTDEVLEEDNVFRIRMSKKEDSFSVTEDKKYAFSWYELKQMLSPQFTERLAALNPAESTLGTEYDKRIENFEEIPEYERGKKSISLPYGVESDDTVHEVAFDEENFAAYLVGASGSGKSTLLHTLITGIIRNYHPDDVELWLADFKMSEFSQYINPMPPHVRYILLDESRELVYDLIDRLVEKMMERQRFFMKNKELKKAENVPSTTYMPIIFVMLDEFSIMSQAIAENEEYRLKLQNLLAKGRALGIKFVFSSQTFTSGVIGLTRTAKAQIQQRIAMKGSRDEISDTLELSASQKTDQVRSWIEALPPHFALVKIREGEELHVHRAKVLYFEGTEENAYEKQKHLIERINARMRVVPESDVPETAPDVYMDKHPIVVDGNSYRAFKDSLFSERVDGYFADHPKEIRSEITLLDLGTPRLMSGYRLVVLTPETRENILLLASLHEQACAASIIRSAMRSYQLQGKSVKVWAYGRNRLFRAYEDLFSSEGMTAVDGDAVCDEIRRIKKCVQEHRQNDELIILLGMERICADFGLLGGNNNKEAFMKQREAQLRKAGALAESEEALLKKKFADVWNSKRLPLLREARKKGLNKEEQKVFLDEEYKKCMQMIKEEYAKAAAEKKDDGGEKKDEADKKEKKQEKGFYDAGDDFLFILNQGSRLGYHFMFVLNNYSDFTVLNINRALFRHRIAFQMPAEESRELYGSKVASMLPGHICQYTDTMEEWSVRPYLHKDIDWEGWSVDENGEAAEPFS